ncbi:MAG: aminomethyl-transferring glycine dehydrogenase, partial [Bacteroidota bacterium]
MFFAQKNKRNKGESINEFFVSDQVLPQTIDVLITRAKPLDIEVVVGNWKTYQFNEKTFGVLLQYPGKEGVVEDLRPFVKQAKAADIFVTVAADLLSLALLTPPGEWGADAVVGNTQRFGVPMGYGGPHAAFFATQDKFKRLIPGRIIGVSSDANGNRALRMALQTREQHIRREKATSNICTAQALLAVMAGMYAAWHGADGIRAIANRVHGYTKMLESALTTLGYQQRHENYFDTVCLEVDAPLREAIRAAAEEAQINFFYSENGVQITLDETVILEDIEQIVAVFAKLAGKSTDGISATDIASVKRIPDDLKRSSEFLTHPVFSSYYTESKMMRYIKRLENKDLSLMHSMIPLGSCTMKLNAATQLIPVTWDAFSNVHPFVPVEQVAGYQKIVEELETYLCEITGFSACSLQPNSGAQGEYAGLLTIRAFHEANGESHRNIALIPDSAHGTNPASAVMAGMKVVVTKCDERGDIDLEDLKEKVEVHADNLAALMITYPSTHGVFETEIKTICDLIHQHGGKVYMDGANMNAQVGLTNPGLIGADVCHLNLHKTFSIPHGGGGPGVGPICVNDSLAPFLPTHPFVKTGGEQGISAVSAAPFGSTSICLISYAYIKMLGKEGVTEATKNAILNANYIRVRLEDHYNILFTGENGHSAHELILDLRPFKPVASAEDLAKRLIDYGFHAPTLSWPVAGTIMIEPTESENKEELDRFCDAMISIRKEMDAIASGDADSENNVLHNAPHTMEVISADKWNFPYSRAQAAYPLPYLREGYKFWASTGRVNNAAGDRNLVCTCPPVEMYAQ